MNLSPQRCRAAHVLLDVLGASLITVALASGNTRGTFAQSQMPATAAANTSARPAPSCAQRLESRQFDFWLGEWDVAAGGKGAGTNSVQLILGECVVFENWTGAGGMHGKSFNFYDAATRRWQQTWVDDRGGALEFTGEFKDGAMRLTGESLQPDGAKLLHRLTFFPLAKDRVRQLWEQSSDGGKTWNVAFDGDYRRKQ